MRSQAFQSFFLSLSLINAGLCFPGGLHYHVPKRVAGKPGVSVSSAGPTITPGPELHKALQRRIYLAANWVTASCDPSGCVFFDVSTSSITSVNASQLTATDGNWCFGPGCVHASSLPLSTALSASSEGHNTSDTLSTSAPYGNSSTYPTIVPVPIETVSASPNNSVSSNTTATPLIVTQGPTAIGTGSPSNLSSTESALFGNRTGTSSFIIGLPSPGPTAGTAVSPTSTSTSTALSNTTDFSPSSSNPTGFVTGTGDVSAGPTLTETSRGPFANRTGTSGVQVGPTGTGLPGTGISPEETSTTLVTNRTTISVTEYPNNPWVPWSTLTAEPAKTSAITCTDEAEVSSQQTRANAAGTSYRSTATLSFMDTTYTVPVPASYTSDVPSPDSNEAEVSSFAEAVGSDPAPGSPATSAPSPSITAYPDKSKTITHSHYSSESPHLPSTTFDAVSWSTESCYTSTFFDVSTSPSFTLIPTDWVSICYGIKCNAASSCQDWMSVVPFTDANGNPVTTTRRPPYANATSAGIYPGQGTGTITYGGGFYPAQTGTESIATSEYTENPWPSSPNATRNSAAYTNTADVSASIVSANSSEISSFVGPAETASITPKSSAKTTDATIQTAHVISTSNAEMPAVSRASTDDTSQSPTDIDPDIERVRPVETKNAAALYPWGAWTSTLDTSTTTDDYASEGAAPASSLSDYQEKDGLPTRMIHNDLALNGMHERAAIKAGRKMRRRTMLEGESERQEKKYDNLLQKKRVEWEARGGAEIRSESDSCCWGFSVYCWFVRSKTGGDC